MFSNKITDIFFDLDHTLWDFDANSILAFEKIFVEKNISIKTSKFIEVYAPINQLCWKLYQTDKISHHELRYKRLRDSFVALNYEISDSIIHQISEDYITYLPQNNKLFNGAIEILDYLKPKYNLHIITNGFAEVQTQKLKNAAIATYFKTITNSEMAGAKKPSPKIFAYALQQANVAKENTIMIGDCIEADVQGALNFGMQAIYFNPNNDEVNANIVSIKELIVLKKYF